LNFKGVFTDAPLRADARNMILMALGTTAICANKAMEAVFGKTNPRDTGPFGSARVILYQIRCAFAHDPLNPVWTPNVKSYKHTYQVTALVPHASGKTINRTIKLHPPTLKNEHLGAADFGGLGGYMALLQYCLAKVEGHPKGNRPYPPPVKP